MKIILMFGGDITAAFPVAFALVPVIFDIFGCTFLVVVGLIGF